MQALQKKIILCIQAAETTEYGNRKENNILQKFIRKFHEPLPSYDKVIEQWTLTEEFKERYEKIIPTLSMATYLIQKTWQ